MRGKKMVFVIGAGASTEVNLPSGAKLKPLISQLLDFQFDDFGKLRSGDDLIYHSLVNFTKTHQNPYGLTDPYIEAAHHIRDSMPLAQSIDNFIDMHRGNKEIELCGKLAIARAILIKERESPLFVKRHNINNRVEVSRTDTTWYNSFFRLLTSGCDKEHLKNRFQCVTLIIFNYDRCVEHFLFDSLRIFYKLSSEEAADLCRTLHIYHPYGLVGNLNWYGQGISIDFGAEIHDGALLGIAQQIKTFTEGTDPQESEILFIQQKVRAADSVVFLGFAYHEQNLQLIGPGPITDEEHSTIGRGPRATSIYGTAKGISKSDCILIERAIVSVFGVHRQTIELNNNLGCADFLNEYSRSISLSD